MKECAKCNIKLNLDHFHKDGTSKDGLYRWCKSCKKEYDKKYRSSNKIQDMYKTQEYKDKKLKLVNENYLRYKVRNIGSKIKSSSRDLEFSITEEDLVVNEYCPILNVKLDYKVGNGLANWYSASIDRIDNSKGYVPGNVWIISRLANTMKSKASIEELLVFSKNIQLIFKEKE